MRVLDDSIRVQRGKRPFFLTEETKARARALRRDGWTLQEIADYLGYSIKPISVYCKDVKPRRAVEPKVDRDLALELRQRGYVLERIAFLMGVSRQRIHQIVRGA